MLKNGGGERARTDDLLRAKQVLSQLSYTPKIRISDFGIRIFLPSIIRDSPSALYPYSEIRKIGNKSSAVCEKPAWANEAAAKRE